MSFEYEMGSNDLFANVSFGGGGRRERSSRTGSGGRTLRTSHHPTGKEGKPSAPRTYGRLRVSKKAVVAGAVAGSAGGWAGAAAGAAGGLIGGSKTTWRRRRGR